MTAQPPTSVFISYAWKDGAKLAQRLYDELKNRSCDPWKDDHRMGGGATWTREIATALDSTQVVVALVSPGSNASEVCRWERVRALRKKKHVIPVIAVPDTDFPLEFEGKIFRDLSGAKPYCGELQALLEGDVSPNPRNFRERIFRLFSAPTFRISVLQPKNGKC